MTQPKAMNLVATEDPSIGCRLPPDLQVRDHEGL